IFLLFLAPFSWGTQKREAAAPKASGCFMGGTCAVREEPGKQNPRSCRAQEFGPKQCPRKWTAEKWKVAYRTQRESCYGPITTAEPKQRQFRSHLAFRGRN